MNRKPFSTVTSAVCAALTLFCIGGAFTFGYSIQQPQGRTDGSRMTFGAPITRLETLTYKLNGGSGTIPNLQEGANQ